ncbi:MAG: protein kinase domain-containing protein [Ardenticatenaceae bacterium]
MSNLSGQSLGSYELIEAVSENEGGTVYKAYEPNLKRQVAIKVLAEEVGAESREGFINEAKTVAKVVHPNIIPIYDVVEGQISYFVMKYVSGTLRDVMGHPMDLFTVSRLVDQIAAGLDCAHAQGVLHLNLKPTNILLEGGQLWLTDFDLAQVLDLVDTESLAGLNIVSLLSTPVYASPEWWLEEGTVDHRADIYSLGIVLYEMVTGVVPFQAEDDLGLIVQHLQERLPEPTTIRGDLPPAVSQVMLKALAKEPAARYQQAGELAEALRQAVGAEAVQPVTPSPDEMANARRLSLRNQAADQYELVAQIGQGGMGHVFKAYQPALKRYVVIESVPIQSAQIRHDRVHNAQMIAQLSHPNIRAIYDVYVQEQQAYIVKEWTLGGTLDDLLGQPLPLFMVSRLVDQIAAALDYAHDRKVLHLNLSPNHILLNKKDNDEWLLLDHFMPGNDEELSGTTIGVAAFVSPEQIQGLPLHRTADVYALGVVLYEMVTGSLPFGRDSSEFLKVLTESPPSPRRFNPQLPQAVEEVILKALAKEPDHRYERAGGLALALRQAIEAKIGASVLMSVSWTASPALPTSETTMKTQLWEPDFPTQHTRVSPAAAAPNQARNAPAPPSPPSPPSAPGGSSGSEGPFQRFLARVRQLLPGQSKELPPKPAEYSGQARGIAPTSIARADHPDDSGDLDNTVMLGAPAQASQKIKHYILQVPPLGGGGMGVVFRAYDPRFERDVALKVLLPKFQQHQQVRELFDREAKTVARLDHPAIVPVYDYGEEENQPYLVMRLMEKGSLAERFEPQPLTLPEAINVLQRVSQALDHAHSQGVIHRDLKPANILFDQYDNAFLADFGVVKLIRASVKHTRKVIVGTPAYMSPEQAQDSNKIDKRSDVYSLGVVLFQILTGRLPYQAKTQKSMILAHLTKPVPNIRQIRADLPPGSENVVAKAMAKKPAERYATASELIEALRGVLQPPTTINLSLVGPDEQTHKLKLGELTLGRSPQNDIQVHDRAVSSRHAKLVFDGQRCIVYDEESTNGTYLNGQRLLTNGVLFNVGDELVLGQTSFFLKETRTFGIMPLSRLSVGSPVQHVAWSPDGTICAAASQGGVRLWDHTNQQLLGVLAIGQMKTFEQSVAWSPDGTRLLSAGSARFSDDPQATEYGLVRMWDLSKQRLLRSLEDVSTPNVQSVAWSPNGYRLALSWGNKIWLWDARTSQTIRGLRGHPTPIKHVTWSPDSTQLASVGEDVRIWNLNSGKEVHRLTHANPITCVAWSPDGTWLAFGTQDGSLSLQQPVPPAPDSAQPRAFTGHTATVTSVAWSPDGTKLLSGSTDHTVRLWDVAKQQELALLPQHTDQVHTVAWSPDGKHIASGSQDGSVQYWQLTP